MKNQSVSVTIPEVGSFDITLREAAILFLMRRMGYGTLDKVGVQDSQPSVLIAGAQRLDLTRPAELLQLLRPGAGVAIDLTPCGEASSLEQLGFRLEVVAVLEPEEEKAPV